MTPELASNLLLTTIVVALFALGSFIYARYFKDRVTDYTSLSDDLGEDSPVIEALLVMRENYLAAGDHVKALECSSKALDQCPESDRIRELKELDRRAVNGY